jgi:hypothetical protein
MEEGGGGRGREDEEKEGGGGGGGNRCHFSSIDWLARITLRAFSMTSLGSRQLRPGVFFSDAGSLGAATVA